MKKNGNKNVLPICTLVDLWNWEPCPRWPLRRIKAVIGDKESFNALEVINLNEDIDDEDIMWVICRKEMLPASVAYEISLRLASKVIGDDDRLDRALYGMRMYVRGKLSDADHYNIREGVWNIFKDMSFNTPYEVYKPVLATYYAMDKDAIRGLCEVWARMIHLQLENGLTIVKEVLDEYLQSV